VSNFNPYYVRGKSSNYFNPYSVYAAISGFSYTASHANKMRKMIKKSK
jgi:hypothetical protein